MQTFAQLAVVERRAHVAVAGRRVHPQLHAAGADSRHRVRVRPDPALPAGDHARRGQQPGQRLGARSQPRRRRQRARRRPGVAVPDEAKLAAVIKGAGGGAADGLRRHGQHAAARSRRCPRRAPSRRRRRRAPGITEWTLSNGVRVVLEADDVQAGRDPVPGVQSRRHVARERSGLHPRGNRRPGRRRRRARHAHARST